MKVWVSGGLKMFARIGVKIVIFVDPRCMMLFFLNAESSSTSVPPK